MPIQPLTTSGFEPDFIEKAAISAATFAPGGVLLPQQSMEFFKLLIKESELLVNCDVFSIPTETWEVDKMGFTGQVLHPDQDIAFPNEQLAEPETGKITHISKRYKAVLKMKYSAARRVIGGNQLWPTLLAQGTEATRRDLEDAAINGDTALAATSARNRLLRLQDGFLKQCNANVVDAEGSLLTLNLLDRSRIIMPDEYYKQSRLEWLVSKNALITHETNVQSRATELGDQAFASRNEGNYHKIPLRQYSLLPTTLTYNAESVHTQVVLADTRTMFQVGYLEEMTLEQGKDIESGEYIAVIRFDVSFKVLHAPATVRIDNVRNQP